MVDKITYTDRGQLKSEQLDYDTNSDSNSLLTTSDAYDPQSRLQSIHNQAKFASFSILAS